MRRRTLIAAVALCVSSLASLAAPRSLHAQERGAVALSELVEGLGTTARVLMIGAHPDDEDTNLIAWLARGRHVETAYLSLTRGDGGQNLIGNELGEALGVIRTEELLAARRVDGGRQYFTRAYDFGFSKTPEDTYRHWPKDSILKDVVAVVRDFRPHVIVAVFSGTAADGHGHHQVSGMLAREAYEVAGDARFTAGGAAWTPLKFYRAARFNAAAGTLRMNVGEYDHVLGRSYAEIAGESRSQHRSQGFGSLERKGVIWDHLRREATRVNADTDAKAEASLFDGIDTSLARLRGEVPARSHAALDSLSASITRVQRAARSVVLADPAALVPQLGDVVMLAERLQGSTGPGSPRRESCAPNALDACASLAIVARRATQALLNAAAIEVEAFAPRELAAAQTSLPVSVTVHNRGTLPLVVQSVFVTVGSGFAARGQMHPSDVPPDSAQRMELMLHQRGISQPWWLQLPRRNGVFEVARTIEESGFQRAEARVSVGVGGVSVNATQPVTFRFADPARGEIQREIAAVPAISVLLEQEAAYARANVPVERVLRVQLRNADTTARETRVTLQLPAGLAADSAARTVRVPGAGAAFATFRLRGRLAPGMHRIAAIAESEGQRFTTGYVIVDYEHIRPQRLYREAELRLTAVDVALPRGIRVAYVQGVSDNVAPMIEQLGISVTIVSAEALGSTNLGEFTTVVVGPRAYEANPSLASANPRLFDWVRRGGTLVVQYGQHEMQRLGMMPFPLTLERRADRVTEERSAVAILDAESPLLRFPNRIGAADFEGWVQERATYMPRTWDPQYRTVLGMNDEGEPRRDSGLLWAPMGQGRYVYAPLAFFRQLPAANPGAARLFVNLLSPASGAARP